jgi:hypothetical protein
MRSGVTLAPASGFAYWPVATTGAGFGAGSGAGGVVATGRGFATGCVWVATGRGLATGCVWVVGDWCAGAWGRVGVAVFGAWPAVDPPSDALPPVPTWVESLVGAGACELPWPLAGGADTLRTTEVETRCTAGETRWTDGAAGRTAGAIRWTAGAIRSTGGAAWWTGGVTRCSAAAAWVPAAAWAAAGAAPPLTADGPVEAPPVASRAAAMCVVMAAVCEG